MGAKNRRCIAKEGLQRGEPGIAGAEPAEFPPGDGCWMKNSRITYIFQVHRVFLTRPGRKPILPSFDGWGLRSVIDWSEGRGFSWRTMLRAMPDERRTIQSVERALDILEVLATGADEMRLNEIARATHLNISTCHHLISTLLDRGYVGQNPRGRTYFLGTKTLELSRARAAMIDLVQAAMPTLRALNQDTGETVHLDVLRGSRPHHAGQARLPSCRPRRHRRRHQAGRGACRRHRQGHPGVAAGDRAFPDPRREGAGALHRQHHPAPGTN